MSQVLIQKITQSYLKKNIPDIRIGDTVLVHQKIQEGNKERIQIFEGLVIARHKKTDIDATFTVRRIASGVGVERVFPLHSPRILKIEKVKTAPVRRAKLYYLRNLSGRAARMKKEQFGSIIWEEKGVETEMDKIEEEQAEAAEAKAEEETAEK